MLIPLEGLIGVFGMWLPLACLCVFSQGVQDGVARASYVRTYNACTGGEMVRQLVLEDERYRASRVRPRWLPSRTNQTVTGKDFDSAAWGEP